MNKRILLVLALAGVIGLRLFATNAWFNQAPTGVNHNASYYVEAEGYTSSGYGDLSLFKAGNYVAGGYGSWSPAGTWQADPGPDYIEYYAEMYDWNYGQWGQAWHYVDVNAPSNQAPHGERDYNFGSVAQHSNFYADGWAADNEMGAPITRVDVLIDGNDVGDATLGGYRPDVGVAYGRSDYNYSGWSFNFGVGSLSVGSHSLEMRAWDDQGASSTFGYTTFSVTNDSPSITLLSPSAQTVALGTALLISSNATDPDGNITTHNLDIQRPDASWNWQGGFADDSSFLGGPVGSASNSTRSAWFAFNQVGTWYVRSWVNDANSNNLHSATVAITVTDQAAPSVPTGLSASSVLATSFTLNWSASTDDVGVTQYQIYKDGSHFGYATGTSLNITGLSANTSYAMSVRARDGAGNWSAQSSALNVTTAYILTAPTALTSASVGSSFATFSWTAGTASGGVKNYKVYRNGNHIGTTTNTDYTDWTAGAGSTYSYTVKTVDNADNESGASSSLSVNTPSATLVILTPIS